METLDKHFRKLADAAFKRYGFAQQDLLSHWPQIVGEDVARLCTPERIRWPRSHQDAPEKTGGTLELRVAAGFGLEVQHAVPRLLERINQFLGYQAITAIKVVQSHTMIAHPLAGQGQAADSPPLATQVAGIDDPDLQAALGRLSHGISGKNQRSPQAK